MVMAPPSPKRCGWGTGGERRCAAWRRWRGTKIRIRMAMAKANTAMADGGAERTEGGDAPLIDLNNAAVKKLIARAKKRGYITYDQLNEALPQEQMSTAPIG